MSAAEDIIMVPLNFWGFGAACSCAPQRPHWVA
jgi:hypothetical protein